MVGENAMGPLKAFKIYWRLRPVIKGFKEVSQMRFSVNFIVQILALAAHGLNQVTDLLPPKGKFWATVALSAIQGTAGVLAHFANPDGTPAEAPYVKK